MKRRFNTSVRKAYTLGIDGKATRVNKYSLLLLKYSNSQIYIRKLTLKLPIVKDIVNSELDISNFTDREEEDLIQ